MTVEDLKKLNKVSQRSSRAALHRAAHTGWR